MYKIHNNNQGEQIGVVYQKNNFKFYVPNDENNSEYQRYLEWLAEGNEPLPADEQ